MNEVFSCDEGKFYKYHRCPHCYYESKRIPYKFVEDAEEALKGMGKPKSKRNNKKQNQDTTKTKNKNRAKKRKGDEKQSTKHT